MRDTGTLKLAELSQEEAIALADILGLKKVPQAPHILQLSRLDAALRSSRLSAGLIETIEALDGPIHDKRAARAQAREATRTFWETLRARDEITQRPELGEWIDRIQRGTLRRIAPDEDPAALVDTALAVIQRLPCEGTRLQVLSSDSTGDPHALDNGMPLATLVQSALASLAQRAVPTSASERRALWEWAGVSVDSLSSNVLVLGLTPQPGALVADALRSYAAAMEPFRITLRQLRREELDFSGLRRVYICENPAVLEQAAEDLPQLASPLICTEGMLSGAAENLFSNLAAAGVELRFHGDFDWGGIRIGNLLTRKFAARPWQFTAREYADALATVARKADLVGQRTDAVWDTSLATAMEHARTAVYEEQIIAPLLADLRGR